VDVTPTILEAIGVEPPATLNGTAQRPLEGVSFAHTFGNADARSHKKVQYYEMIASRALWADGWKAVVEQPQGAPLTEEMLAAQRWELYHVESDFSECDDLAGRHPEKLAELVEQWWAEASKYNVLPLDSRMQLRMAERKPATIPTGNRRVFYPGGAPQFEYTAVNVKNRSHTITAQVEIPDGGAEGVLLAHGSWFSGYSFYVKGGRLVYVHNCMGLAEYRVESAASVSSGRHSLSLRFRRSAKARSRAPCRTSSRRRAKACAAATTAGCP
jgi:arylsulfatase